MQIVIAPVAVNPLMPDAGTVALLALLSLVPALIIYVWTALALSRVFTKVGVDGWKAWVPVYNAVVFLGLGGLSGWLLLLWLIPIFGPIFVYVAAVTAAHRVGTSFGYGPGMTVLAALLFPVWASILGFGGAQPQAGRDAYAYTPSEETGEALRALSPDFGRPGFGDISFEGRRDVPAPSAWIPPAPGAAFASAPAAPYEPAPAYEPPAYEPATPEGGSNGSPWAPGGTLPPPAPSATAPVAAPPSWDVPATDPAPAPPEPVTSWWMPAPEPEEPAASAAASARERPAPESPAPEPVAYEPAPIPQPSYERAPASEPAPMPEPAYEPEPAPEQPAYESAPAPESVETPEPAPARPVLRQAYVPEPDAFPEESGAVSAVAGSPTAGAPRAAASSISAFRPGMSDFVDDTVIASRKRPAWSLQLPDGSTVELTGDTAVLGRRPVPVHSAPGAQLITIVEETRTVSKTHALLRRQSEMWVVSDLGSTNGVVVDDSEVEPGETAAVEGDFLLGDAVLRLIRRER
jgi:hypothetical protein